MCPVSLNISLNAYHKLQVAFYTGDEEVNKTYVGTNSHRLSTWSWTTSAHSMLSQCQISQAGRRTDKVKPLTDKVNTAHLSTMPTLYMKAFREWKKKNQIAQNCETFCINQPQTHTNVLQISSVKYSSQCNST